MCAWGLWRPSVRRTRPHSAQQPRREGGTIMPIPVDYEILRVIWWLFLGVLLIGFAIMDGFDLGVATLLPFVARTETERRVTINTIGPVWEGNQVWLITGGGAIFAAFPPVYAASFSGFYIAMFLVLATLILRPVGFEFRNKIKDTRWRAFWDYALFAGGFVPSLVFGVAFGNILQGVPFGILCGLVSVAMLTTHGAVYLTVKAEGPVKERAKAYVRIGALVTVGLFIIAGIWTAFGLNGYAITSAIVTDGPSNPLLKTVAQVRGQWFANFGIHKWMMLAPALAILGPLLTIALTAGKRAGLAFITSAIGIFGVISTAGVSMFPFLMPSDIMPQAGLTVWDATSSQLTLFVMLIATLIFLPIVLAYTGFVFRVLKGPVTAKQIEGNSANLY